MDIDLLAKMVKELVLTNKEVGLPGLGTFVTETVPASFSDRGYTINPPYRRLSFHPGRSEEGLLVKLYAEGNNVDEQTSRAILTGFLTEMKDVLKSTKVIVFPGLGRLRATRENNFFFVCDEDLDIYPGGYGLEPVSLKSRPAPKEEIGPVVSRLASIVAAPAAAAEIVSPIVEAAAASGNFAPVEEASPEEEPLPETSPEGEPSQETASAEETVPDVEPAVEPESEDANASPEEALPVEEEEVLIVPDLDAEDGDASDAAEEPVAATDISLDVEPAQDPAPEVQEAAETEPAPEVQEAAESGDVPAPGKRMGRGWRVFLVTLLVLVIVAAVALAAFLVLAKAAPDFIDSLLYTPEELRILNY